MGQKSRQKHNNQNKPAQQTQARATSQAAGGAQSGALAAPVVAALTPTPEETVLAKASPAALREAIHLASALPLPTSRDEGLERLRIAEALYQVKLRQHEEAALELESELTARQQRLEKQERDLQEREQRLEKQREELKAQREAQEQRMKEESGRLTEQRSKAQEDKREADARIAEQRSKAQEDKREADARLLELKKQEAELKRQEALLLTQRQALQERAANAEAGFVEEQRRIVERTEAQLVTLRAELEAALSQRTKEAALAHERARAAHQAAAQEREEALRTLAEELRARRQRAEEDAARLRADQDAQLERERAAQGAVLRELREAQEEALREVRERVAVEQDQVERERAALRREQQRLQVQEEALAEDRADLQVLVEEQAAAKLETMAQERRALEERLHAARQHGEAQDRVLRSREEADRRFGQRTPDEVLRELQALQAEKERLLQQLSERPDRLAAQRLQALEDEREANESERLQLQRHNEALKSEVSGYRIGAAETERLRDEKMTLEAHSRLLRGHLDELKSEVERRLGDDSRKACFPALLRLDQERAQQERPALDESPVSLPELVKELQQRIAAQGPPLYYQEEDLRCFLAGLSASKLLLLQGISGTGKTSLPRAVADALGWGHDKVEVQAGWRDRDDLIGHYNAFERRFHEKTFLQALYRAQSPALGGLPFLLVLDEMNLSHPEQYFADLLSALEEPTAGRRLVRLLPHAEDAEGQRPALLREGRDLLLPANLWFIGTANHDETTKDFADKTYDRAHVMELPRHPPAATAPQPLAARTQPLALAALDRAFERARRDHAAPAQRVNDYIEQHLAKLLDDRFRIGFGNRLERQIKAFVPVVIACGGKAAEAADHLLATKLLRRLRDRHDVIEQDLKDLQRTLTETFGKSLENGPPRRSLALLHKELARLATREQP